MPRYDYIQVTLSEMLPAGPHVIYSYPAGAPEDSEAVFDATAAIKEFLNLRECYALWSRPQGHYFALLTPDPANAGHSLALTLRLDNECALSGKRTVAVLNELKKLLVEDRSHSSDSVDRALAAINLPRDPEKLKSWSYEKPLTSASAPKRPLCYRTYASTSELDSILSFPSQVEYACFERVLTVQATASLRPGARLDRITAPLKREYTVVTPVGCSASRTVVSEGERLTLTFTKAGFNPRTENISVGAPSPYVRYDGSAIRVKTPAESGMGFVRRIPLSVRSAKGMAIHGFTINVNGRPINTMEPFLEITEKDLAPDSKTEIQVASNNYKPLKVIKTPADLVNAEKVELVLEPIEQGITLRLDFGQGRIFQQEITLEKNTKEYSQLHSGNFHGFRAHRLTVVGNAEVYNVDMASPLRTAPNHTSAQGGSEDETRENSRHDESPRKPVAPVFDKVTSSDSRKESKAMRDRSKAIVKEIEEDAKKERKEEDASFTEETKRGGKGVMALIIAVGLILIACIVFLLLPDSTAELPAEQAEPELAAVPVASDNEPVLLEEPTTQQTSEEVVAPSSAADEAADIAYLNSNTKTWKASELKTEKYRSLITALEEGNIDAFVGNDYIAVSTNLDNKIARSVADMLWAAKGTPNQGGNERAMRKYASDGNVALYDLYEAVARVKPAEPNPSPRPVR